MPACMQGRLPIRVELSALTQNDLYRILTEPAFNLVKQQQVRGRGTRSPPLLGGSMHACITCALGTRSLLGE